LEGELAGKRRFSTWLALGAALYFLATLGGCAKVDTQVLRFGLASAPVTLDPRFATDATSDRINRLLYSRLVDFDTRFRPVPSMATWSRVSPLLYRFHLRATQRDLPDGGRLSAHDVRATYEFILDPANASPHRGSLSAIVSMEVIDEDTIDFHLSAADPLFPGRLVVGILPEALIRRQHPFNRQPVGSGPFEFVQWPEEGRLQIRRRSDGQVVEFLRVPNPTVRVLKLVRGEIDMLQGELPFELVSWLSQRDDTVIEKGRGTTFAYLGFNMEDPVVSERTVRRAIAHALDRDAIIAHVFGHAARPASALLPPDHWAGDSDLPLLGYAPEKSRRLLEAAGLVGKRAPRIVYKTSSDPFRIRLATIIQSQLSRVGIHVDLQTYDWGTFYGDIKAGRFQMHSLAWVGVKMPDIFRYVFHSESIPPQGANRGRFASAVADRLIEQAEMQDDLSAQAVRFRELQRYLLTELPYVPLWYEDNVFVARVGIAGFHVAADGNYDGLVDVTRQGS
jgi:peptide/nickel transport system substrate-binding protein